MELDALIDTVTEDEGDAVEEVIIGEELAICEELILEGELVVGEELIIIEEVNIAEELAIIEEVIPVEELNIAEKLIIGEDKDDTALVDNTDETAEVVVHEVTLDDAVLVLARLDVAAADDMVELVARRVDEDGVTGVLVGELATSIPATKLWPPEVNEADADLK
jgi:hypothetical protein